MDIKFLEQFLRESQQITMDPSAIARTLATVIGSNNAVSQAAMQRLHFEDEPASFAALLDADHQART